MATVHVENINYVHSIYFPKTYATQLLRKTIQFMSVAGLQFVRFKELYGKAQLIVSKMHPACQCSCSVTAWL